MRISALTNLTIGTMAAIAAPYGAAVAATCEGIGSLKWHQVTITSAESVVAPSTIENPASDLPANMAVPFCRVAATLTPTADSDIKMEVWLPAPERWNGKFEGIGNGGLAGAIPLDAMTAGLERGYATAATDTGHNNMSGAGTFALGHPEKVIDYAFRSTHLTAAVGKRIAEAYYGRAPVHAYFSGCSQGGQEAMMEAQRFPDDYDGVIAGDPNLYQTHHYVGAHIWIISALYANPNATISTGKATLIGNAVDQACDAADGVRDGVLEDPRRCQFDPRTLQCSGADASHCLTKEQVDAVGKLWTGPDQSIHPGYYPGLERGGEGALWRGWIAADGPFVNLHGALGIPFARYFIFNDPNWDFRAFDFKSDPQRVEQKLGEILDANDPNLRRFRDRGGRLIQYHGYSDPDIPPRVSIDYHDRVARFLARRRAPRAANAFYRLFMVPGMGHCTGGPGATSFDMLTAIEQWVERGVAPAKIIATKFVDDDPAKGVARTHPLCPFPQVAKYAGTGKTNDAANFACAEE